MKEFTAHLVWWTLVMLLFLSVSYLLIGCTVVNIGNKEFIGDDKKEMRLGL